MFLMDTFCAAWLSAVDFQSSALMCQFLSKSIQKCPSSSGDSLAGSGTLAFVCTHSKNALFGKTNIKFLQQMSIGEGKYFTESLFSKQFSS